MCWALTRYCLIKYKRLTLSMKYVVGWVIVGQLKGEVMLGQIKSMKSKRFLNLIFGVIKV